MNLLGFDFSVVKPAALLTDINFSYFVFKIWPRDLSEKVKNIYRDAGIFVIDRDDEKNSNKDSSGKIRFEVENSIYLAEKIRSSFTLDADTLLAFEGFSFNSGGNAGLQLSGYKYILMDRWSSIIPMEQMYTYAPQTIKKTAGCSQRGKTKDDMIQAFIDTGHDIPLRNKLEKEPDTFKKKGGKNWIDHLDDIVDAFWVCETLRQNFSS